MDSRAEKKGTDHAAVCAARATRSSNVRKPLRVVKRMRIAITSSQSRCPSGMRGRLGLPLSRVICVPPQASVCAS